jgi:hypothetical protein
MRLDWTSGQIGHGDGPHEFVLSSTASAIEIVAGFWPHDGTALTRAWFAPLRERAASWWRGFWTNGAAIDFAGSTDPRAAELERRVVLSQYLTAVNCSGTMPPQETGLVTNSWQGKFQLEMHWWHSAHFAAWGRPWLLERSLKWYESVLATARATAARQGYHGACWPKQTGPDGRESPGDVGPFLIWQQPHLLYLLELLYRGRGARHRATALTRRFGELAEESARFMASFAEERDGTWHLPAPIVPAQEAYKAPSTEDPTFELAYWWWGLEIAQRWRDRRGKERSEQWQCIQDGLARPRTEQARYTAIATEPYLRRTDHPSLLCALGFVPATPLIDPVTMGHPAGRPGHLGVGHGVGLGLPRYGDDRHPPAPSRPRRRRAPGRQPEEQLPADRPLPADRQPPAGLPPRERSPAGSGIPHDRRVGRGRHRPARIPQGRDLDDPP